MKQFVITIHHQRIIPAKRPLSPEGRDRQRRADSAVCEELKRGNGKLRMGVDSSWEMSYICRRKNAPPLLTPSPRPNK